MREYLGQHGLGFLIAFATTAAVVVVRLAFADRLGDLDPFTLFGVAVLAAGLYGGLWPALVATALGVAVGLVLFVQPAGSFQLERINDFTHLVRFLLIGVLSSLLCHGLITTRRRLQQWASEVQRAGQELHIVTEGMSALVVRCSRDLRYLWVSQHYADWIGRPVNEVIGRPLIDILGPWTFEQLSPYFRKVLAGEKVQYERELHIPGLGLRWVNAIYTPTHDRQGETPDGWVAVILDVTDRKQADEKLRRSEGRLGLLWEAATVLLTNDNPDAMLHSLFNKIRPHLGLDTYFNFLVNDAGDSLLLESCEGISPEEVEQIKRLEFGQAICGTVAMCRRAIVVPRLQESDDPRTQLARGYGIRVYVCHPLMIGDRLLGTLSFASRTRDQFAAEELEFLRTVCYYVTVAYERLNLIRQLREADRRKDEFLATLAHELRNPLAPIRNSLHMMRLVGNDFEALNRARATMERQLQHMTRLVDDLLEVSRITRGRLTLRREPVELATTVQVALEATRPMLEAAGHALTVTLPTEPVFLDADPTRLAQVFSNLLNNAVRYTEKGGHVWLTAGRDGSEVVVRVRDTGIGIAPEHLEGIFEMFSQIAPALERSQSGLGIGLALVRGLVELHGGSVEARSPGVGKGSEFLVRLPVVNSPEDAESDTVENGTASGTGGHRRILVVDDNHDAASSLMLLLQRAGHEVQTAHDGLEAIERAAGFHPDVVILDLGMPKMNGYDAARHLRQQPGGDQLTLIALTGWGQDEDRRRTREAGFDHHLTKPVDFSVLLKLLSEPTPQGKA